VVELDSSAAGLRLSRATSSTLRPAANIDADGRVLGAAWKRGVEQTIAWVDSAAADGDVVMFVDAPLVVRNETGQRLCEKQVGQRYWRWKVSANTTNTGSPRLAGVQFLRVAGLSGWRYSDGSGGPPRAGRIISETYPYATLVGAAELGYDTERPRYKRKPRRLRAAQWRTERAATCDTLIKRLGRLADADPPLLLHSHPVTRELAEQPSPAIDSAYKHRKTSSMPCCAPGPHRCGHATALTAARSSACPPMPPATRQPR
jgi:hypothetical protein